MTNIISSPGRRLREAWAKELLILPGVFNALAAKMAETIGFRALYLSGGALSASTGVPDIGLLTLPEFLMQVQSITQACSLPLLSDADTGFGESVNVERAVRLFELHGVAGIHLEDQVLPKRCGHLSGKQVIDTEAMVAKLRAAVAAKRDPDFVIVARTDARSVLGFDAAVARAHRYLEAGADAIFPEALESVDEFARFAQEVPAPLLANMTEFGRSPSLEARTLQDLGYKMVIFPLTAFRVAMKAAQKTLENLYRCGHARDLLPEMLTRAELYDLLGYTEYEARDRAYFGFPGQPESSP